MNFNKLSFNPIALLSLVIVLLILSFAWLLERMDDLSIEYYALLIAIIFGVIQSSLNRENIGKIESDLPVNLLPRKTLIRTAILMTISTPLNILSNLGLWIILILSFFNLEWMHVLLLFGFGFVWSFLFAGLIGYFRIIVQKSETLILKDSIGIPLQLFNRAVASACVIFLTQSFLKWGWW